MTKPVILCILDGWGYREEKENNAIAAARTPNYDRFLKEYPHCLLQTSGLSVGLPEGQMGNSEVGHMTIGAGRVIMQELPRINRAVSDSLLINDASLKKFCEKLKKTGGACHLLGLISDGGVHAHINHIIALAKIISLQGIKVNVHAITDGRDTPPESGLGFIARIVDEFKENSFVKISTICGRYFAMDRDKRWERVKKAYDAIISAEGERYVDPLELMQKSYKNNKTDEFIEASVSKTYEGVKDKDGILMANFRADRARQILTALLDPDFQEFERGRVIKFVSALGMVHYSDRHAELMDTIFRPQTLNHNLGEIIADSGLKQLRIAETEKYAHVTFFLNGGREDEYVGEERVMIPSPKVRTYDLQPEMAAEEVTEKLVAAIDSNKYDLIVVNFANTDMVGHTGIMEAAIKAVEKVDKCIGRIKAAVLEAEGALLITADHGNVEQMVAKGKAGDAPHTSHTTGPVPCLLISGDKNIELKDGSLASVAPTILELMKLDKPEEMTGDSLIKRSC